MIKKHLIYGLVGVLFLVLIIIYGSNASARPSGSLAAPSLTIPNATQVTKFDRVCAGKDGAPGGFSIQWTELPAGVACSDFVWPADSSLDPSICKASFSGVPGCSIFNLAAGACATVEIGNLNDSLCGVSSSGCGANELKCGTTYVQRAFAHNDPAKGGKGRSAFTTNVCITTDPCARPSCVSSQGFWKNHPEAWPVLPDTCSSGNPGLNIGTTCYEQTDLLTNLGLSPAGGNALLVLSHQLIAAELNILAGASGTVVLIDPADATNPYNNLTASAVIAAGNDLIDDLNINTASVAASSDTGKSMIAVAALLDLYNTGEGGVGSCK